jgi:hypothetical protein
MLGAPPIARPMANRHSKQLGLQSVLPWRSQFNLRIKKASV